MFSLLRSQKFFSSHIRRYGGVENGKSEPDAVTKVDESGSFRGKVTSQ